jgi:hypothetical protein
MTKLQALKIVQALAIAGTREHPWDRDDSSIWKEEILDSGVNMCWEEVVYDARQIFASMIIDYEREHAKRPTDIIGQTLHIEYS